MFSKELYNKLKQTNISHDARRTRDRVKTVWSALDKQQKQEVFNISDLKKATLERTCREGNLSVKLATALAEISRVDPYFLAAMTDDMQEDVSDAVIEAFLIDHNYKNLIDETKQTVYYRPEYAENSLYAQLAAETPAENIAAPENPVNNASISQIASNILGTLTDDDKTSLESMTEDDMIYLLKALNLRARFNDDAKSITVLLKKILIG